MASQYLFSKLVDAEMFILATRKVAAEAGELVHDGMEDDGICMALRRNGDGWRGAEPSWNVTVHSRCGVYLPHADGSAGYSSQVDWPEADDRSHPLPGDITPEELTDAGWILGKGSLMHCDYCGKKTYCNWKSQIMRTCLPCAKKRCLEAKGSKIIRPDEISEKVEIPEEAKPEPLESMHECKCVDNSGYEAFFDKGIEYMAEYHDDRDMLWVYDKFANKREMFKERFERVPGSPGAVKFMNFAEMADKDVKIRLLGAFEEKEFFPAKLES